jgi:hypothetical protein
VRDASICLVREKAGVVPIVKEQLIKEMKSQNI